MAKINPLDLFVRGFESKQDQLFRDRQLSLEQEREARQAEYQRAQMQYQNLLGAQIKANFIHKYAMIRDSKYRDFTRPEGAVQGSEINKQIGMNLFEPNKTYLDKDLIPKQPKEVEQFLGKSTSGGVTEYKYGYVGDPNNPNDDIITKVQTHNVPKPEGGGGELPDISQARGNIQKLIRSYKTINADQNLDEATRETKKGESLAQIEGLTTQVAEKMNKDIPGFSNTYGKFFDIIQNQIESDKGLQTILKGKNKNTKRVKEFRAKRIQQIVNKSVDEYLPQADNYTKRLLKELLNARIF